MNNIINLHRGMKKINQTVIRVMKYPYLKSSMKTDRFQTDW